MPHLSTPASPASARAKVATLVEKLPKVEKTQCPKCGIEAKPFSRFCESCGHSFDTANTGKLKTPPTPGSLRTQAERPPSKLRIPGVETDSRPTRFDQQAYSPAKSEDIDSSGGQSTFARESSDKTDDPRGIAQTRKTISFKPSSQTANFESVERKTSSGAPHSIRRGPAAPTRPARVSGSLVDSADLTDKYRERNNRAAFQTLAILGVTLLLAAAVTIWWLTRNRSGGTTPVDEQVQTQPSPGQITLEASPSPPAKPSPIIAPEGMVYVPGGAFEMGRNIGDRFESPTHNMVVEAFFIDRTEVTNEDYQKFVKATRHRAPTHWRDGNFTAGEDRFPVVNVSWSDATSYAKWAQKRLPTESEWEYAARGGDGRIYPWGNNWSNDSANAGRGVQGRVVEVGNYPSGASPFGVLDMCGNVWEWTSGNLFSYADKSKEIAPGKVIRGGAFDVPIERATSTYRGVIPPERMYDKTGFRCARNVN
jgi:formylglycine-generating enzyme required for sulfatase activity